MIRQRPLIPAVLLAATLAAVVLPGCARMRERLRGDAAAEPASIIEPDAPAASATEQGLEVVVWTTDDTYFRVGRALDRVALPEPVLPPDEADTWRRAGLRIVAIPVGTLDALVLDTPPLTPLQRQRYGQMPVWSPVVRGPQLPPGVTTPSGRRLDAGRPRLIARSWIEPDLSSGRALETVRTELAIQIESARRTGLLTDPGAGRSIADAGEVVDELIAAVRSDGRSAFVIVAESPDVEWSALPEPPPAASPSDGASPVGPTAGAEEPAATSEPAPETQPGVTPYGPANPRPRTLGEWMLASPGTPARNGRPAVGPRKVIMVLVPRLRERPAAPSVPLPTDRSVD